MPFGNRLLQGVVFDISDDAEIEEVKEVAGVIGDASLLSEDQLELARWISEHYLAPLFESASLMLPPGFERRHITFVEPAENPDGFDPAELTTSQKKVIRFLRENGRVDARQLKKVIPQKQIESTIRQLAYKGLIVKTSELQGIKLKPKLISQMGLAVARSGAQTEIAGLSAKAPRQADILKLLLSESGPVTLAEASKKAVVSPAAVKALERKGLIIVQRVRVLRDPLSHRRFSASPAPELTLDQAAAWEQIRPSLQGDAAPDVFLVHGVTGSGKTEIYLRALEETVRCGRRGIVLVPEIALTPQTIERFSARFPGRVAVIHSRLSPGEQFDEWHRIREGEFDVVIGSRSALFAPQPDLGLIVIDEEHEWTYKQHDKIPLYHARDVALKLAKLVGATVILGSATPDLLSYHRAQRGDYRLLELPRRVGEFRRDVFHGLPIVEIVDLREELKSGNRSIFSRKLKRLIDSALDLHEQVILFLNRRGTSPFVQCRDCGHVVRCRRCDISLTYHAPENQLVCHQCNLKSRPPTTCPECGSPRIKFLGIGTKKVEEEAAKAFPRARLLRWDRDVTQGKYSHEQILKQFQSHEADILIGTQMIAKGLDIPLVTLVGIVNADTSLYLPHFGAGERTFQILSQVAGRSGRGRRPGQVVIQTYTPDHYAIRAAALQDYGAFYDQEIAFRHQYGNPPFNRLASLLYAHTNARRCQEEAQRMMRLLRDERDSQGLANMALLGPVPAFVPRLRGRYRWQLIIRGPDPLELLSKITFGAGWTVDIDPVGLG